MSDLNPFFDAALARLKDGQALASGVTAEKILTQWLEDHLEEELEALDELEMYQELERRLDAREAS